MIIFEFDVDRGETREISWLGTTSVTGADKAHKDEIYEQLTAHDSFLTEE